MYWRPFGESRWWSHNRRGVRNNLWLGWALFLIQCEESSETTTGSLESVNSVSGAARATVSENSKKAW